MWYVGTARQLRRAVNKGYKILLCCTTAWYLLRSHFLCTKRTERQSVLRALHWNRARKFACVSALAASMGIRRTSWCSSHISKVRSRKANQANAKPSTPACLLNSIYANRIAKHRNWQTFHVFPHAGIQLSKKRSRKRKRANLKPRTPAFFESLVDANRLTNIESSRRCTTGESV